MEDTLIIIPNNNTDKWINVNNGETKSNWNGRPKPTEARLLVRVAPQA